MDDRAPVTMPTARKRRIMKASITLLRSAADGVPLDTMDCSYCCRAAGIGMKGPAASAVGGHSATIVKSVHPPVTLCFGGSVMIALKAIFLTWRIGLASAVIFAMISTNGFVAPVLMTWIALYVAIDTVTVRREVAAESV